MGNTGAVQSVNAKDLADIAVSQIAQNLEGKLEEVEITQGTPGSGMSVRIRNSASLSAN